MLGIPRPYFDQVTVVAGHVMDLEHFGAIRQRAGYALIGQGLIAADGDECEQPEAEGLGIDLRAIAADDAPGFELADPFEDRRGGEADRTGDIHLGFARVRLELIEDLEVDWVEGSLCRHNRILSLD